MVHRARPHILIALILAALAFGGCWLTPAIPYAQLREERNAMQHRREVRAADMSKECYRMGVAALKSMDRGRALACFSRAAALEPSWMLAHLSAAVLHPVVDNNIPAALEHARRAAELAPNNPRAHLTWGTLLLEAGKCPEAFAALERAVELRPSVDEGHYRLARAAACGGQPQRAIDEYLYLMARHPGATAYYLDLALLYEREGMLQEAGDILEKALLVSGYSRVLLLQVRNFYARTGQNKHMQEIDEELQRRFPAEKKRKMRPLRPSKGRKAPKRNLRRRY